MSIDIRTLSKLVEQCPTVYVGVSPVERSMVDAMRTESIYMVQLVRLRDDDRLYSGNESRTHDAWGWSRS